MSQLKRTITYIDKDGSRKNCDIHVSEKNNKKNPQWIMKHMNVGFYLAVPLLAGVFLGDAIDRTFQTKPVFTLILLGTGMIAAFYNLFKILKDA